MESVLLFVNTRDYRERVARERASSLVRIVRTICIHRVYKLYTHGIQTAYTLDTNGEHTTHQRSIPFSQIARLRFL